MKTIFLISFLMSSVGFAQGDFATQKQQMLSNIEQNIAGMTAHKDCVTAAQKAEDLQKCRGIMREAHMGKRMEHMEMRKGRMDEKMKRMQGKMAAPAAPPTTPAPTEAPKQ